MTESAVRIVTTTSAHIREIAPKLRKEDRAEVEMLGFSANKALWRSFKGSVLTRTAFIGDEIAAVWGVGGPLLGNKGIPFLLTTPAVEKISPLKFAHIYQREVLKMLDIFPKLANYVDASYTKAVRLLDIIGFTLGEPEPIGVNGQLFCKFEIVRK